MPVQVFHTNEGHAGFLGLERIRMLMESDGLSFAEALEAVRAGAVFTTHTPVPAGIDRFPRELIEKYFGSWAAACGISIDQLMALGHRPDEPADEPFNMAVMGMRLAERRNGVSALHGEVSREMFCDLWPGVPVEETPVGSITNGVHGATWVSAEMDGVLSSTVGEDWQWADDDAWQAVTRVDDDELWQAHMASKVRMVDHVRDRLRHHGLAQGRSASELEWVDAALDPAALTICFARRMATYKRAALLLSQPDRLRALLADDERPIQFVFAGKAHPADDHGKELIRQIVTFSHDPAVRHRFVFVEDYDMALARSLVQGADVWLNTPVRPMEASGTSGMKAVLNGALHCSVLDGWWAECFSPATAADRPIRAPTGGRSRPPRRSRTSHDASRSRRTASSSCSRPRSCRSHDTSGWTDRMIENLRTLGPFVERAPHGARLRRRTSTCPQRHGALDLESDGLRRRPPTGRLPVPPGRGLAPGARRRGRRPTSRPPTWAREREVTATVALGELHPDEVEVQLVCGHVGQSGELEHPTTLPMDRGRAGRRPAPTLQRHWRRWTSPGGWA